ncbi:hypothetical protein Syun_010038 [Stephania yunnanensis]|uniref:Uncharacterized protein n=1 Tax=Stephania yunnanensis TaxID=152371 RepID=A0AAP0KHM3_9MAGN
MDEKKSIALEAVGREVVNMSSQRLRDREMLMDSEEMRIIIFSSKTCGDVGLEIGNAIRVHHPWKDISGNYTMRSFYHEVVKLQGVAQSLNKDCVSRMEPSQAGVLLPIREVVPIDIENIQSVLTEEVMLPDYESDLDSTDSINIIDIKEAFKEMYEKWSEVEKVG